MLCYKGWLPQLDAFFHPDGNCKYVDTVPEMLYALYIGEAKGQLKQKFGISLSLEVACLTQEVVTMNTPNVWKAANWMLAGAEPLL